LTPARKRKFENKRFHNLTRVAAELITVFDIDILEGIRSEDIEFADRMFHRRHVYEHKGGEADEKYIAESGDTSVRPKQALHETVETSHKLVNIALKMAANLHRGFHDILPPISEPIHRHQQFARNA